MEADSIAVPGVTASTLDRLMETQLLAYHRLRTRTTRPDFQENSLPGTGLKAKVHCPACEPSRERAVISNYCHLNSFSKEEGLEPHVLIRV